MSVKGSCSSLRFHMRRLRVRRIRIFGALLIMVGVIAILTVPNFTSAQSPTDEEQDGEIWLWVPTSPDGTGPLVKVKVQPLSIKQREAMDSAPVARNKHPEWNTCNPESPYYNPEDCYWPPRFESSGSETALEEQHYWWGTDIYGGSTRTGAWATHQIDTTITIKSGQSLYAPTLLPSNYCPLESVTAYWDKTKRAWRGYNHVGGVWWPTEYFTAGWVDAHVRNWNGVPCYDSRVVKEDKWYLQLYNYSEGEWEQKASSTGSSGWNVGWEDWEEWYLDQDWPTLPEINCFNLRVRASGTWRNVTSTYGCEDDDHLCEGFPPHGFHQRFYAWWVGPKT